MKDSRIFAYVTAIDGDEVEYNITDYDGPIFTEKRLAHLFETNWQDVTKFLSVNTILLSCRPVCVEMSGLEWITTNGEWDTESGEYIPPSARLRISKYEVSLAVNNECP